MIDYEPRVSLKIFSSSSVVRRIDTLLDGVESRIDNLETDRYTRDIESLYDDISKIRTLLHEADEPLVDKANNLWAENKRLKMENERLEKDLKDAKQLLGELTVEWYQEAKRKEQED